MNIHPFSLAAAAGAEAWIFDDGDGASCMIHHVICHTP